MPRVPFDLHYVNELIEQREAQTKGLVGAPKMVNGYRQGASLNRSCIVMLSAQLQAYVEEVFIKASNKVLIAMGPDDKYYKNSFVNWGNPNDENINRLFARLGIEKVLNSLSWENCPETKVYAKLKSLNELRNGIAHGRKRLTVNGQPLSLTLSQVRNYRNFLSSFCYWFEDHAIMRVQNG